MVGDAPLLTLVAVATHNQQLVSLIAQKLKGVGLSVTGVLPTVEAIHGLFEESQSGVVVLDALQNRHDAVAIASALAESRPLPRVVILGGRPDLALVANAVVAKAADFLLDSTPSGEFGKAITDLLAGKCPSTDSLFGRVWAELPVPTGKEDSYRTPSGRRLTAEEAITQCDQFGIGVDEIAKYLRTPVTQVERVTKKARTAKKPSMVWEALVAVTPQQKVRLPSLRVVGFVLALAVAVGALMLIPWREPKRHVLAGEVTYQGKPVPLGLIRFTPQGRGESARPIVAGEIRNGKYAVHSGHGSDGGSYRVQVSGFNGIVKQAGPVMDPMGDQLFPHVSRTAEVPCSDFLFNVKCD